MRYLGGKSKLAKKIRDVVLSTVSERDRYLEPFVGGGAVFEALAPHFARPACGDLSPDVAALWHSVKLGWRPPTTLSREEWSRLKADPDPSALRAFAGFGCSFGGAWFHGYAWSQGYEDLQKTYPAESARSVLRAGTAVKRAVVGHGSFDAWPVCAGDVVYCDPPYAGTASYEAVGTWDPAHFWRVARSWAALGALVFVSEYVAPADAQLVAEFEHRTSVTRDTAQRKATVERLFFLG